MLSVVSDLPHEMSSSSSEDENIQNSSINNMDARPEYTCLQPGSLLRIRIGDPSASRKAWKKRRRSGSPILIPCSILDMDRIRSIQSNLKYLVQKYGRNLEDVASSSTLQSTPYTGIALKAKNVVRLWEREFGSSLLDLVEELDYGGVGSLLLALFNSEHDSPSKTKKTSPSIQNPGVYILKTESNLILHIPTISVRRGRMSAASSSLIQMISSSSSSSKHQIQHTGFVLKSSEQDDDDNNGNDLHQLGVALRVNSNSALSRIKKDEIVTAYVFQYDPNGDNGSPLLVMTLDPPKSSNFLNGRSNSSKKIQDAKNKKRMIANEKVSLMLDDLAMGDGPYKAKVVKISSHSNAAFLDLGVGRKRGKTRGGGVEKILGMLRFDDLTDPSVKKEGGEDEHETFEDLSHLYQLDDDGVTLYSVDPETKEKRVIGSIDDTEVDEESENTSDIDESDLFFGMDAHDRLKAIGDMLENDESEDTASTISTLPTLSTMQVGDDLDVYIRNVFPQSRRFMVSCTKPSLTSNNREKKSQKVAQKRLSKLSEGDILTKMKELAGTECDGVVKAVSKTGDWFYVAPDVDAEEHLPKVGVAHPISHLDGSTESDVTVGTRVRVRLEGLDEKRGQLSMSLLGKKED